MCINGIILLHVNSRASLAFYFLRKFWGETCNSLQALNADMMSKIPRPSFSINIHMFSSEYGHCVQHNCLCNEEYHLLSWVIS